MSSSIKLKNANGKTVSVTNSNANQTDKEVIYLNTVDELANASGSINAVAIVSDLDRGGTFEWSATGTANGGTVFAGATGYWIRQYSDKSTLSLDWFGVLYNKTDEYSKVLNAINAAYTIVHNQSYTDGEVKIKVNGVVHIGTPMPYSIADRIVWEGIGIKESGFIWVGGANSGSMFNVKGASFGGFKNIRIWGYNPYDGVSTVSSSIANIISYGSQTGENDYTVDIGHSIENVALGGCSNDCIRVYGEITNFNLRKIRFDNFGGYAMNLNNSLASGAEVNVHISDFTIAILPSFTINPTGCFKLCGTDGMSFTASNARVEFNGTGGETSSNYPAFIYIDNLSAQPQYQIKVTGIVGYLSTYERNSSPCIMAENIDNVIIDVDVYTASDTIFTLKNQTLVSSGQVKNIYSKFYSSGFGIGKGNIFCWEAYTDRENPNIQTSVRPNDIALLRDGTCDYLLFDGAYGQGLYASYWSNARKVSGKVTIVAGNNYYSLPNPYDTTQGTYTYPVVDTIVKIAGAGVSGADLYTRVTSIDKVNHRVYVYDTASTTVSTPFNVTQVSAIIRRRFLNPRTTTQRNAVTMGANDVGATLYDSTLSKQVWWNGTAWKDYAGTTV